MQLNVLTNIAGGGFQNVLVIGADALSRYVDWTDRGTCILFGDAAGAVLVQVVFSSILIFSMKQVVPWSSVSVGTFLGNVLCIVSEKYIWEYTFLV